MKINQSKRGGLVSLEEVRRAVANYMRSEGCSCCQNYDAHKEHTEILGKLLKVKPYKDGSGYDFSKYREED